MSAFYGLIKPSVKRSDIAARLAAVALLALLVAPASGQIAFPDYAIARTISFATDGTQVIGTHSFGVYKEIAGALGKNRWLEATIQPVLEDDSVTVPITVNDIQLLKDGTLMAATTGPLGLYRSPDGLTWTQADTSAFFSPVDSLNIPYIVYAITQDTTGQFVYLSSDDGKTYFSQDGGVTYRFNGRLPYGASMTPWALEAAPTAGVVVAGTHGYGVQFTSDYGGYWYPAPGNRTLIAKTGGHVFDVVFDPTNPNRVYAATGRGVWRLDDLYNPASTWTMVTNTANTITLLDLSVVKFSNATGTAQLGPEIRSLAFDASGTLYMASWGYGILSIATPSAPSAGLQQVLLRNGQVYAVAVNPNTGVLVASSTEGLVTANLNNLSTATEPSDADVPGSYTLAQNYPNPFNPETTIGFDLPASGHVHLAVYDVLGRQVAKLADGVRAAGSHQVTLNAAHLSSGLYLYRLTAAGQTVTRTMSLMK